MALKDIVVGLGALSLMSFSIIDIQHETKAYTKGTYYYSDNKSMLNYKAQYENLYSQITNDFDFSLSSPKFNDVPKPKPSDELLKVGIMDRISFFTCYSGISEEDYLKIKDKSSYTFAFNGEQAILAPTDLNVVSISPNTKSGIIPSFDSYFSGEGVKVILEGTKTLYSKDNNLMNEYKIRIKIANLSKIWQSLGHIVSFKNILSGRELYYTNFISTNNYLFSPGAQIAVTGNTGTIAEIKDKTSYVTVTLEKRLNNSDTWRSMTFNEFYGLE